MYLFSLCISISTAVKPSINVCCNRKYFSAPYSIHYLAAIIKKNSVVINNLERACYAEAYGIRIHITVTLKFQAPISITWYPVVTQQ